MKSGVIPMVLLVAVLAVLVSLAQGLECYHCVSTNHPNPGSGPKTPVAHDKCERGYDLPDNLVQTCTERNSNNFYNISDAGWMGEFACAVNHVPVPIPEGEQSSVGSIYIRSCTWTRADKVESICYAKGSLWGIYETTCYCYDDKCNKNVHSVPTKKTVGRGRVTDKTNAVVGLGPQAIVSAFAVLFSVLRARL